MVVDAGAGTGGLLPRLRAAAPQAVIVGLDLAAAMLGQAAGWRDRQDKAVLVRADLAQPPLRAAAADVVVCGFVLFHLRKPAVAVTELAAALPPGGWFAAATWAADPFWAAKEAFTAALDAAGAPTVASARLGAAFTQTPEALAGTVESAGLRVVGTEVAPLCGPAIEPAELMAEWTALGSSAARFAGLDSRARERVHAEAMDRITALPAEDRRDPHEVIRVWAVKE